MIIIHILHPVASKLGYPDLEPRLQVAVVMYNCCPLDILLSYVWVVTKSQYVPRFVKSKSAIPEGY